MPPLATDPERPRVVIVGAGFGGLSAARSLAKAPVDITVVDSRNYHLFQPLLYQVATAALSPADIASPIREILRDCRNVSVRLAEVTGIDIAAKEVAAGPSRIPFDYLIVATGARHSYFGHDRWADHAKAIKTIDDATALRRRILLAFERAETEPDEAERLRLLTFVIVGGGPTGVELAGAVAELARGALKGNFRAIDPSMARIILVEAGPRLLPGFAERLSDVAAADLTALGVEVKVSTMVTDCDDAGVALGPERIGSRTVVWAAGVEASPAGRWLAAGTDRSGRVLVAEDLSLPGHPEIFVIGDAALVRDRDGRPLPGVAPAAKQEGRYVAGAIQSRIQSRKPSPFRYRDPGALATIGRRRAVAQFGRFCLSGGIAWCLWSIAHIYFLIGFRNRIAVAMNWAWSLASSKRGTRLIEGGDMPVEDAAGQPVTPLRNMA
jgi:NADH dehydrogenase